MSAASAAPAPAPILRVRGLAKQFGALVVAQAVDLDLVPGARVGLIGPNGAGKTTIVNLLTGTVRPDAGTIELAGEPIQSLKPEDRVRRGLARTHQINALLMENTVRDNVALAVAERRGHAWRALRYASQWRDCAEEADARLAEIGLGTVGDARVSELPYGRQRLLEIALALALKPRVLLLDEPGAGVPSTESHIIHDVLGALPPEIAILIIEHDMDLVFRFAAEIIVLVQGAIITRDEPSKVAANPQVQAVYLGRKAA